MKRPSIRRRLILGCLLVTAVVLGLSKVSIYREVERSLRQKLDRHLLQSANLLSKSVELEAGGIIYEWKEALDSAGGQELDGLFQFWDLESDVTTRSPDLKGEDLEFFHGGLHEPIFRDVVLADGKSARAVGLLHYPFINSYGLAEMKRRGKILSIRDYPQVVVCARDNSGVDSELRATRIQLYKSSAFTLVGIGLAIYLIIRWTLAPIDQLASALVKRSTQVGTPLPSIPENLPIELLPLSSAFNSTLERVELARAHEKDFAFSAAHQLRTPIAGIHAILELAHSKPKEGEDLHQRIGSALEVTREMKMTINTLMRLARLRGGVEKPTVAIYRPSFVLCELAAKEADGNNRELDLKEIDPAPVLEGDEGMFRMLATNLIENAFRHAPEGSVIRIVGRMEGGYVFDVINLRGDFDGKDAERIFRPFQRGGTVSVNTPGAGLGLALAKEIVAYLGGSLELLLDEHLMVFRVRMPH